MERLVVLRGWTMVLAIFVVIGTESDVKAQAKLDSFTYSYSNLFNGEFQREAGFTEFEMVQAVEEALTLWSQYVPLSFAELPNSGPPPSDDSYPSANHPDIRIGHHAFDDNLLGHAYLFIGSQGLAGDVHLDSSNRVWSEQLFLTTVTHELGHSIGLDHLDEATSVMNTRIGPENTLPGIGRGFLYQPEITAIQDLWGVGSGTVTTTRIWKGGESSNWSGHANWSQGFQPTHHADVFLQTAADVQIDAADQSARSITLGGDRNSLRVTDRGSIDIRTDVTLGTRDGGAPLIVEGVPARTRVPRDPTLQDSWMQLDFDDEAWKAGQTGIGFDRSSGFEDFIGTDVEAEMYNRNASVYTRVEFTVDDASELDFLTLRMRYDDGFVAYLNGTQVATANSPNNIVWNSRATETRNDRDAANFQEFDISSSLELLRSGSNLLAIHGLNARVGSSDMLISPTIHGGNLEHDLIVDGGTMNVDGNLVLGEDRLSASGVSIHGGTLNVRGNVIAGPGTAEINLADGILRVEGGDAATIAVDTNSTAHTLIPANGDLMTTWTATTFNDTDWQQGTAALGFERNVGFGDLIDTDLEAELYDINGSFYSRMEFDASNLDDIRDMTLSMQFDDGFVAYLNGQPVARANAPDQPVWNSTATDSVDDDRVRTPVHFDLREHIHLLNDGANVLAIHGLNQSVTSSDLLILPKLSWRDIGGTLAVEQLNFSGGQLLDVVTIVGRLNLLQGTFSPSSPGSDGHQPGHLTVTDAFQMHDEAVLELNLDGSDPSEHDALHVAAAQLSGTLSIALNENGGNYTDPTVPGDVDQIVLLTADTIDGVFRTVLFDDEPLTAHEGEGLFRALVYAAEDVSLRNYRAMAGDANGDGRFDSSDLIRVFQAGEYEDSIAENSDWTEGDWDGDSDFTSSDVVLALQAGHYNTDALFARAVPEPSGGLLILAGLLVIGAMTNRKADSHRSRWSAS